MSKTKEKVLKCLIKVKKELEDDLSEAILEFSSDFSSF